MNLYRGSLYSWCRERERADGSLMDWSYVKLGWSCWQKVLLFTPRVLHSACLVQNKVFFMSREAAAGDFTTSPTLGLSPKDVPGEQGHSAGCIPRQKKSIVRNHRSHQTLFKGALKYSPSVTQTSQPWQGCLIMLLAFCEGDTRLCRLPYFLFLQ